jgi:hypothetical protein
MGINEMTKVFDGQEFTFTVPDWLLMLNSLEVYAAEALNTTERHKNAVLQMTRRKDVEDYDYTVNYPAKLHFG